MEASSSPLRGRWGSVCLGCALAAWVLASSRVWLDKAPLIVGEDTVLRLPLLSHWGNLPTIFSTDFTVFSEGEYRPLSYALLAVLRTWLPVENAAPWRVCLLALQALNVTLVYCLARQLLGSPLGALAASGLFAAHPLAAVVIGQIDHFPYALGLTLYLASWCCYTRAGRSGLGLWWLGSIALFAGGLLTTRAGLALPVVLAAWEFTRRGRGVGAVLRLAPFVGLVGLIAWLWHVQGSVGFPGAWPVAWWRIVVSVVAGSWRYVQGLVLGSNIPVVLSEVVARRRPMDLAFWCTAGSCSALCGCAIWLLWRARVRVGLTVGRVAGLAVVWGFATFAPFLYPAGSHMAWPYVYFPLVGVALLVGSLGAAAVSMRHALLRRAATVLLLVWCIYLGLQLVRRNMATGSDVQYWQHALELNPQSERASVELGKAHLRRGDVHQAIPFLYNASVTDVAESCRSMAEHYLRQGELLAAAVHCRWAGNPRSGAELQTVKSLSARLLRAAGALDQAQAEWHSVLAANQYHTRAMAELAAIWRAQGLVEAAQHLISRAREIDPSAPALAQAGASQSPAHGAAAASEVVDYALGAEQGPQVHGRIVALSERLDTDPIILLAAGLSLTTLNQPREALEKLDAARPALDTLGLLWAARCYALVQAGDWPAATHAVDKALTLGCSDPFACSLTGAALIHQGRHDRAMWFLRRAVDLDPSYLGGQWNYALALEALGNFDKAAGRFSTIVRLAPTSAQAHMHLGAALLKLGKAKAAVRSLHAALRLEPTLAQAHVTLADALTQTGDPEGARKHLGIAARLKASPKR